MRNTLISCNEWTSYDLRKIEHLDWNSKPQLLEKYITKRDQKMNLYVADSFKINLYDKKWWSKALKVQLNGYLTYQKTIINEKELNKLTYSSFDILPNELTDDIDVNIYYRYQKKIKDLIK